MHHPQVGRQVRRRLILRDRAEDVTLLALQLLEDLLAHDVVGLRDVVGAERLQRVRHRLEVADDAVDVLVVEAERRHADVEPRANLDRPADERVEPVGLHAYAFGRQTRRAERRIRDQLQEVAAVVFDDVAADAVAPVHDRPSGHAIVGQRALRRERLHGLRVALEAEQRRHQALDFDIRQVEVRHAQLVERLQHASLVELARVVQLAVEPPELRRVRDVGDESKVEARDELAALFRQIRADGLRLLEALDLVTAVAAVPVDDFLAEVNLLRVRVELGDRRLGLFGRHQRRVVIKQRVVDVLLGEGRLRRVAAARLQRHQIRRDVGRLRV